MKERGNKTLRMLDRYVGIPLVCLLGLVKKKVRPNPDMAKVKDPKILLLKTAGIGDTIFVSAIVRELKSRFPSSGITLICTKSNYGAAKLIDDIEDIFVFDISHPLASLRAVSRLGRFHMLFDFAQWARLDSVISLFANAGFKVGFKRRKMFRHYTYDLAIEHSDDVHELENYLNLLRSVNIPVSGLPPRLSVNGNSAGEAWKVMDKNKVNVILHLFPGGSKKHLKEWPIENWIDTGLQLAKRGYCIFISGSNDDAVRAAHICSEIQGKGGQCETLAGRLSLSETAAVIQNASLLITVDTGIMHLGAALSTKMIALHGPTSPLRWGAVNSKSVVLKPKLDCSPCLSLGFESRCSSGECMKTITVGEVLRAVDTILQE